MTTKCLNPCSNGIDLITLKIVYMKEIEEVLILVLMELVLME